MTDISADPCQLSLCEAAARARTGVVAPMELLTACLHRVDAFEPGLHAWASLDRDGAHSRATALGAPIPDGGGPLHGIPIGVKDNIDTAGVPTAAGSPLLADNVPAEDAAVVRRLHQAGAIVMGKTVCTELATNDPAPTRNPWHPAHSPGGSSAGSGVAVATGMCFATIDTQTAGDVLRPAAYSGVVGFKPSYGWTSRRGVLPVAWSIDTVGVQAKTVRDVSTVFGALAGPAVPPPSSPVEDHVPDPPGAAFCLPHPPRIAVVRDYFYEQADEEVRHHTDAVVEALAKTGATVVQAHPAVDFPLLHAAHRAVTFVECAAVHEQLYHRHAQRMGQKLRTLIELGLVTPAVSYTQAQRVRARIGTSLQHLLDQFDVVLTPPAPSPPPDDPTTTGSSALQIPWTFCGLPTISIPTGLSQKGLPLGIQLAGALRGEQRLLAVADWCQQAIDHQLPVPLPPPTTSAGAASQGGSKR